MSRSRRMMAVVVAALLIAAMILPGLAVKAEAAEEPEEKPKVEVSLVGDKQMFEAGYEQGNSRCLAICKRLETVL